MADMDIQVGPAVNCLVHTAIRVPFIYRETQDCKERVPERANLS